MKRIENIEEYVRRRKPDVTTGESMDKRVLDDSFSAMDERLAAVTRGPAATILRGRMVRLAAAAAVVIIVIGLLLIPDRHTPNHPASQPQFAAQSPTMMVSMMSLRMAYQRGGWEALDRQFRATLDQFGPISSSLSMQQLLEGSNGS
jgi:hypothetical protein